MKLERVALALNVADIFIKQLGPLLFRQHGDYLMGRVPPRYSAHYQNIGELANPVRLQRETGATGDQGQWVAAAAKVVTDPIARDKYHSRIWGIVTEYWSRSYGELLG